MLRLLAAQFRNPLLLILIGAAGVSIFVGEWLDAGIILAIIAGSALLSFSQEYSASRAMERLRRRVQIKAVVVREGRRESVPIDQVVPGDEVLLSAGSLVPGDAEVIEADDCYVNEAVLTGETYPAAKGPGDPVYLGTSVRSGRGCARWARRRRTGRSRRGWNSACRRRPSNTASGISATC